MLLAANNKNFSLHLMSSKAQRGVKFVFGVVYSAAQCLGGAVDVIVRDKKQERVSSFVLEPVGLASIRCVRSSDPC